MTEVEFLEFIFSDHCLNDTESKFFSASTKVSNIKEFITEHREVIALKVPEFAFLFEKFIQKAEGPVVTMLFKFLSIL